jgi:UDP-N-acetylmuramate dehydrogenase
MMDIFQGFEPIVQRDYPLGEMTTFGVGGPAEHFARPRNEKELHDLLVQCEKHGVEVRAIGRGSNILVLDEGVPGVVVQLDRDGFGRIAIQDDLVRAGAAALIQKVVHEAARAHLSGLECLVGIPGTVGGAVRMNAGGIFGDIGRSVERVKVTDVHGETFYREREDLEFAYRWSNISARFILEAELRLMPDSPRTILARMKKIWMAKRNTQPTSASSAGCTFKNPRGMAAGALIDQAGLKGESVAGAVVSHKHANYIVVKDRAKTKAADLWALIQKVRTTVRERMGVDLELEIEVWPKPPL